MNLTDFMVGDAVLPSLSSQTRDEAIAELVDALVGAGRVSADRRDEIVAALIERENQGSTGIGKGIAVPHVKTSAVTDIVGTIGSSEAGIDFSSLDNAPVYSVLLLLSPPNDPDRHLEAMESLFAHLQRDRFRKFLRQAETRDAVMELLAEADAASQESGL